MTNVLLSRNKIFSESVIIKRMENICSKYLIAKYIQNTTQSLQAAGEQKAQNRLMVYGGGELVALALDIEIREGSNNQKSLGDLMKMMYQEFGKTGNRYTSKDVLRITNQLSGKDLTTFFNQYVYGNSFLDINPYLNKIGLKMNSFVEEVYWSKISNPSPQQAAMLKGIFGW